MSSDKEMKLLLIEESTSQDIPQSVETLLLSLDSSQDKNDVICVLLFVLMVETGFIPQNEMDSDLANCDHNFNIQVLNNICSMPSDWKNNERNFYELLFYLGKFTDYPCKLVIIPSDDVLIANLLISNLNEQRDRYSFTIQTSKYIPQLSDYVAQSFRHLKQLSLEFKNKVSHPARSAILTHERILNSSLLGIPDEIKMRILKLLNIRDIINVSLVCHDLHRLCEDQNLWKCLLSRDYHSIDVRRMIRRHHENDTVEWKEEYKTRFKPRIKLVERYKIVSY